MSDRSKLPVWTRIWAGDTYIYEGTDSRGRTWRMWFVEDDAPSDPFPAGWRFAPIDELDQINFIAHVGGGREFDTAAMRIDAGEVVGDPGFRHRMGLDEEPTE